MKIFAGDYYLKSAIFTKLIATQSLLLSCQNRNFQNSLDPNTTTEALTASANQLAILNQISNNNLKKIQTESNLYLAQKIKEKSLTSEDLDFSKFGEYYRVVIGETSSCFSPSVMLNSVRLGIENETQRQQLMASMKAVTDFAIDFYDAMKGQPQSLFKTIELCGVGQLAKHIPTEARTKKLLELQGEKLIVWNDKFLTGYTQLRTDSLHRAWLKGHIESDLLSGKHANSAAKLWPIINPIGTFRRTIRNQLAAENRQARQILEPLSQISTNKNITPKMLSEAINNLVNEQANNFASRSVTFLNNTKLPAADITVLTKDWQKCLQNNETFKELEELATCSGLEKASKIEGEQVNVGVLVGVMNFHNIQVEAQMCFGPDTKSLAPPPTDSFKLKQTCGGLISVCTVDNVNVFAKVNLLKNSGPTLCLARALKNLETRITLPAGTKAPNL